MPVTTIRLPQIIHIGGGAIDMTASLLADLGLTKPFLVTDRVMAASSGMAALNEGLSNAGVAVRSFLDVVPDPTASSVTQALAQLRTGDHDCVIGFGGGSSIDTAKAVAVLARRGGQIQALKAPHVEDRPGLPIVAIPTTAGTGSEATRFTIITDEATDEKMLCAGAAYLPVGAIIDHHLTLTKPPRLTADTGVDALTHAIEAYVSRKASPVADLFAREAMSLIAPNLRRAYRQPQDEMARERVMRGSLLAGIAFSNASVALVHGMSRPIGAHFHLAHGLTNAVLLPYVTEFSIAAAPARYAACARACGVATETDPESAAAERLVVELRALNHDLNVPSFKALIGDEDRYRAKIPTMVRQALSSGSPQNNPRIATPHEIGELYMMAW